MKPQTRSGVKLKNKRKLVLERLIAQLVKGTKTATNKFISDNFLPKINGIHGELPLTPEDILRINKEIEVLTLRIK
jgi:hypothetical protein